MNFSYKIQVGGNVVNYYATAESENHKAYTYDGSGEVNSISTINYIMYASSSMNDFVERINNHGATKMVEDENDSAPASSGMSWGANSSDDEDEE